MRTLKRELVKMETSFRPRVPEQGVAVIKSLRSIFRVTGPRSVLFSRFVGRDALSPSPSSSPEKYFLGCN